MCVVRIGLVALLTGNLNVTVQQYLRRRWFVPCVLVPSFLGAFTNNILSEASSISL